MRRKRSFTRIGFELNIEAIDIPTNIRLADYARRHFPTAPYGRPSRPKAPRYIELHDAAPTDAPENIDPARA